MFLSVLCFFLGILLCQQWSVLLSMPLLALSLVVALLMVHWKYWRFAYFLMGVVYGSLVAHYYLSNQLAPELQATEVLVQGHIIGLPEHNAQRVRFDFQVTQSATPLPNKLRISWYYPKQKVRAGQKWQFYVKLKQPHGTLNPGGFDYEKWLFIRHIGATAYVREADKARLLSAQSPWVNISVLRQNLADLLTAQDIKPENLALIKALTIGDKSQINAQQWQLLSKTGTSHLMAISGLHIGLIAGMVYWLLFQCWLRFPSNTLSAPQFAAVFAFLAALFYAALAGFSIPTQRALIMLSVLMLTIIMRRHVKTLSIFALALLAVLLLDPMSVLAKGFYLSFLAVFCIVYVLSARLGRDNRFFSSLKIHVVVALSLLPILLFFFQSVSIIAPVANFIAVPMISFVVVPLSLIALAFLELVPSFAALLLHFVDLVLQVLWQILNYLVDIPRASIVRPQPRIWQMLVAMLGVLWLLAPRGIPARSLGAGLLLPLLFMQTTKPEPGEMIVTLLDVGQGLAVVIETAEHSLVFDTGARFSDSFDMGKNVLLPFLHFRQINHLDKLVISHADNDHIGGARALLKSMPTERVLTSVPEKLTAYGARLCHTGYSWQWDQINFQFLSPPDMLFSSDNDNSCVLRVEARYGSILLTGDIERLAETYLAQNVQDLLAAEVLIAPHHGSKTSSSQGFLAWVQPEIILIPADLPNRFGFPHAEVLARYRKILAQYFISGKEGAITIKFGYKGMLLESYRESHRHYWNKPK